MFSPFLAQKSKGNRLLFAGKVVEQVSPQNDDDGHHKDTQPTGACQRQHLKESLKGGHSIFAPLRNKEDQAKRVMIMPPAITEAIWPETLMPTACMSRKFWLSSSRPILLITRADIGKAEMPAAPIMGLIFSLAKML